MHRYVGGQRATYLVCFEQYVMTISTLREEAYHLAGVDRNGIGSRGTHAAQCGALSPATPKKSYSIFVIVFESWL